MPKKTTVAFAVSGLIAVSLLAEFKPDPLPAVPGPPPPQAMTPYDNVKPIVNNTIAITGTAIRADDDLQKKAASLAGTLENQNSKRYVVYPAESIQAQLEARDRQIAVLYKQNVELSKQVAEFSTELMRLKKVIEKR